MSLAFKLHGVPSGACPPKVVFKWRHFGKYTGVFTDKAGRRYKGNGQMVSSPAFNLPGTTRLAATAKVLGI